MNRAIVHTLSMVALCCLFLSCSSDEDECQILFEWTTEFEFDLPLNADVFAAPGVNVRNVPGLFSSQLSAQGLSREDVSLIQAREVRLFTVFDDFRLNFIDRIDLSVFDTSSPNTDVEISFMEPVSPSTDFVIQMFPSLRDATSFLEQDLLNFRIEYGVRDTNQPIRARLFIRMQACGP